MTRVAELRRSPAGIDDAELVHALLARYPQALLLAVDADDDDEDGVHGGANVVARYPTGSAFFAAGFTQGTTVLQGTTAALDDGLGAGRVVLLAFDPIPEVPLDPSSPYTGGAILGDRVRMQDRPAAAPFTELPSP